MGFWLFKSIKEQLEEVRRVLEIAEQELLLVQSKHDLGERKQQFQKANSLFSKAEKRLRRLFFRSTFSDDEQRVKLYEIVEKKCDRVRLKIQAQEAVIDREERKLKAA